MDERVGIGGGEGGVDADEEDCVAGRSVEGLVRASVDGGHIPE